MNLIPFEKRHAETVGGWYVDSTPPAPGLPMLVGNDQGQAVAYATVVLDRSPVVVDGLAGAAHACRYILRLSQELAVATSAGLVVRPVDAGAEAALEGEGFVQVSGRMWAFDSLLPTPPSEEEEDDEDEDDDEDDEALAQPRHQQILPKRQPKRRGKKRRK